MLILTEAAGAHMAEILTKNECPEDMAVRFVCTDTGDSLILDNRKEGDTEMEHGGRTVLLLDAVAVERLDELKLDLDQTGDERRLVLTGQGSGSA